MNARRHIYYTLSNRKGGLHSLISFTLASATSPFFSGFACFLSLTVLCCSRCFVFLSFYRSLASSIDLTSMHVRRKFIYTCHLYLGCFVCLRCLPNTTPFPAGHHPIPPPTKDKLRRTPPRPRSMSVRRCYPTGRRPLPLLLAVPGDRPMDPRRLLPPPGRLPTSLTDSSRSGSPSRGFRASRTTPPRGWRRGEGEGPLIVWVTLPLEAAIGGAHVSGEETLIGRK